jgi:hypothetical protein
MVIVAFSGRADIDAHVKLFWEGGARHTSVFFPDSFVESERILLFGG